MAAMISQVRQMHDVVVADGTLRATLGPRGFDTQRLDDAIAVCDAAQAKWNARQQAMAVQLECTLRVNDLFDTAVKSYADFRETARAIFPDEAALKALGATAAVPDDLEVFLTQARSAYAAGRTAPYTAALSPHGYPVAVLEAELGKLDVLQAASKAQAQAISDAQKATRERDEAAQPLQLFRR
jgi:hypothetical protein